MFLKKVLFFNIFFVSWVVLSSQEQKTYKFPPVKYVSIVKNLSDYYLYANGGYHADWYVGYNNAWIVNLGPIDTTGYKSAYIGVKLGRTKNKTYPTADDLSVFDSKIMVSISQSPIFNSGSYVLTENSEIPLEPLSTESIKKVDSSKWFWTPIPINKISTSGDNYVAVWANSKDLTSSSNSPIIAAAILDDEEENVWLNHSIKGALPVNESSLDMPIKGIKPAIVIKLVSENDFKVIVKNFEYEKEDGYLFKWSVIGVDIHKAWLEISYDRLEWRKFGSYIFSPPYFISFSVKDLPKDVFYLRACANDSYENIGCSNHITLNLISEK